MAENTEKKVLIDVEVKAKEALKAYAELKIQTDALKEDQKALKTAMENTNTSTDEGTKRYVELRAQYESVGQEIKALNTRAQEYQKEIQSNIKYEHEQEGSLQKLKQELSLNTAAYNKLSEAERNSVKGSMLQKQIQETTAKLKEEEEALGNHRRSVGDYEKATRSLRAELKEYVAQLAQMTLEGKEGTQEFEELRKKAGELRDAMDDANQTIRNTASDTHVFEGLNQGVQTLIGSFGLYQSALGLSDSENKKLAETMKNLQVVMAALSSLQAIYNAFQKQSAMQLLATSVAAKSTAIAQKLLGASTVTTSVAFKLLRGAIISTGIGALIVLIGTLIANMDKLTSWFNSSANAEKEATKASEAYEAQQRKTTAAITQTTNTEKNAVNERNNRLREEILEMKKNGATAEQIANVKMKAEQDIRDISVKASQERIKQQQTEQKTLEKSLQAEQKVLDVYLKKKGEQSDKYKEQKKVVDDLVASLQNLKQTQADEAQSQIDANLKSAEAAQQASDEKKKKYQDNALKMLDLQKKLQEEQNKLAETGMSKDFLILKKWEEKKFTQTQEYEKKKLDLQKKFGQITKSEYDAQYAVLDAQTKTFQQTQLKGLQDYYNQQRQTIVSLLGQSVDAQIKDVEEKYKKASEEFQKLMAVPEPQKIEGQSDEDYKKERGKWERFKIEQAFFELELERKQAKEIEAIRNNNLSKILSDIETRTNKSYDDELAKFTDNEREKNRIEIEMTGQNLQSKKIALQKELNEGRIAQQDYNREIYEDEAQLRTLQSQQNQLNLNTDLLAAKENSKARYEARKAYLEKESGLYAENADKQKEIAAELAEVEKEYLQSRIEAFEEWSGRTMDLLNGISELTKAIESAELQKYEEDNEAKKTSLESRLNSGRISQEQYDREVAKLDADLDKKKAEIARKQAIREKLLKVFDIGINTAAAIMKNTAQLGLIPAIPVNIATGILGAVQLAAVLATPLPKASRGKLIQGPSHAAGGTVIEAEGGEAIINKRSTAMYAPLLSAINQAGGGVPFVTPLSDGGYAARNSQPNGITAEEMKEAMQEAISNLKIYTTIEDIRRGDKNYSDIEDRANY